CRTRQRTKPNKIRCYDVVLTLENAPDYAVKTVHWAISGPLLRFWTLSPVASRPVLLVRTCGASRWNEQPRTAGATSTQATPDVASLLPGHALRGIRTTRNVRDNPDPASSESALAPGPRPRAAPGRSILFDAGRSGAEPGHPFAGVGHVIGSHL